MKKTVTSEFWKLRWLLSMKSTSSSPRSENRARSTCLQAVADHLVAEFVDDSPGMGSYWR